MRTSKTMKLVNKFIACLLMVTMLLGFASPMSNVQAETALTALELTQNYKNGFDGGWGGNGLSSAMLEFQTKEPIGLLDTCWGNMTAVPGSGELKYNDLDVTGTVTFRLIDCTNGIFSIFGLENTEYKFPEASDVISVKGQFTLADGSTVVEFPATTFQYMGRHATNNLGYWRIYTDTVDSGSLNLDSRSLNGEVEYGWGCAIFLSANGYAPAPAGKTPLVSNGGTITETDSATGEVTDITNTAVVNSGYTDKVKAYYLEGIAPSQGDIFTVKGKFITSDGFSINFKKTSFQYMGEHPDTGWGYWSIYQETVVDSGEITLNQSGALDPNPKISFAIANHVSIFGEAFTEQVRFTPVEGSGKLLQDGVDVTSTTEFVYGSDQKCAIWGIYPTLGMELTIEGNFYLSNDDLREICFPKTVFRVVEGDVSGTLKWVILAETYVDSETITVHTNSSTLHDPNTQVLYFSTEDTSLPHNEANDGYMRNVGGKLTYQNPEEAEQNLSFSNNLFSISDGIYLIYLLNIPENGTTVTLQGEYSMPDGSIGINFEPVTFQYVMEEGATKGYWSRHSTIGTYDDITEYRVKDNYTAPTKTGYVFAGWYKNNACTEPLEPEADSTVVAGKTYYAKFVDKDALNVKAQVLIGTTSASAVTQLRLVTTVDCLDYQEVGFQIDAGGSTPQRFSSTLVYKTLKALDIEYTPNTISAVSEYFVPLTITGIRNAYFSAPIGVKPYWITYDGTQVEGIRTEKKAVDGILETSILPTYPDDTYIELAAFMGPRRGGYRYWNGVYGEHPEDPEDGWNSFITERDFQDYINAGFTHAITEGDAWYDYNFTKNTKVNEFKDSDLYSYMELAERLGLKVMPSSNFINDMAVSGQEELTDAQKQRIDQMLTDLSVYQSFKGLTLYDEPTIAMAKSFRTVQDYIWSKNENFSFFTAMLPIYSSLERLTATEDLESIDKVTAYQEYLGTYSEIMNTFAYDYYPLWSNPEQGNILLQDYYRNFELVAQDAKKKKYDAGIVIQSSSWGKKDQEAITSHLRRITGKADISFQVYSALAYGMKYINYYTYWEHYAQGDNGYFYDAMVMYPEENGQDAIKTDTYYIVQDMNQELKKFDHVFMKFNWEGTQIVNPKTTLLSEKYVGNYQSPRIETVTSTDEAIVGCLSDHRGYDGFMLVNATEPSKGIKETMEITFKEATTAICYINGEASTVTLDNGKYTCTLEAGQGIFIIPIK